MKVTVKKIGLAEYSCEAVVVTHCEGDTALQGAIARLDEKSERCIREVIDRGDFEGKLHQVSLIYTRGSLPMQRVVIVGLGKRKDFSLDKLRGAYAKAAQYVRSLNLTRFATSVDVGSIDYSPEKLTEAIVEGVVLGLYQFTVFKTIERDKIREMEEMVIVEDRGEVLRAVRAAAKRAEIISGVVHDVRDIVSMPGNEMTPADLANEAKLMAASNKRIRIKVLDVDAMKELGMNSLLAVARGSHEPAKFIILEYSGGGQTELPVVLVGKAITFDSGGISVKPADGMEEMKSDMAGGAAVMGAIIAAAELNLPVNCVGLIPATENLPGGKAYKPGDILKSMSGKTIEVLSTDAEGRLILADAIAYAERYKPAAVIDLATLTGACIIALGDHVIGMMGTDKEIKKRLRNAGEATGERVWELPLWEDFHEQIKSDVADFKNHGGRAAGTITAAAFLSKFVGDYPWVHLDIAGPAWLKKDQPYIPKGASGVGVRLLVEFLRDWSETKRRGAGSDKKDGKAS